MKKLKINKRKAKQMLTRGGITLALLSPAWAALFFIGIPLAFVSLVAFISFITSSLTVKPIAALNPAQNK